MNPEAALSSTKTDSALTDSGGIVLHHELAASTDAALANSSSTALPQNDQIPRLDAQRSHANPLIAFKDKIIKILQLRWPPEEIKKTTHFKMLVFKDKENFDSCAIAIRIKGLNLAEAVLIAEMIEGTLAQTYQIKSRISTQCFPVKFVYIEKDSSEEIGVILRYHLDECIKVLVDKPFIFDERFLATFQDPTKNYYAISVTPEYTPAIQWIPPAKRMHSESHLLLQETVATILNNDKPQIAYSIDDMRILVITAIGLGAGNYMHALRVIKQLAEKMPLWQIDWILADYDLPIPAMDILPSNIRLHRSRMLAQQFPVIQYLSLQVDVVISLPNDSLYELQTQVHKTPMLLSNKCPHIVVKEYNATPSYRNLAPHLLPDILLLTGINEGERRHSLGIVKPDSLVFPIERREKKERLQQDSTCAKIFADHPEASLYFSYIYTSLPEVSNTNIVGLQNRDVLAFFIQYAKYRQESHIKMILPIRAEDIQEAIGLYPTVFDHCTLQLYTHEAPVQTILEHGTLTIQVYALFPFVNTVFRGLSDYASSCNTPVVMTGDQSFFEVFFTERDSNPVVLYQLLKHKRGLFNAIQNAAILSGANHVAALLVTLAKPIDSEASLIALSEQVFTHYEALQSEFQVLKAHITKQPDMVEALVSVIPAVVTQYKTILREKFDKKDAIWSLVKIIDGLLNETISPASFMEVLNLLDAQVRPTFSLQSLLTEYYANLSLFTSLIYAKKTEGFINIFIHLIQLNEDLLQLPLENDRLSQTWIEIILSDKKRYEIFYTWLSQYKTKFLRTLEKEFFSLQEIQRKVMRLLSQKRFEQICDELDARKVASISKILIYNDQQLFEKLIACLPSPELFAIWMFFINQDIKVLDIRVGFDEELSLLHFFCNDPDAYLDILHEILDQYEMQLREEQLSLIDGVLDACSSIDNLPTAILEPVQHEEPQPLITKALLAPYYYRDNFWQTERILLAQININTKMESVVLDALIYCKLHDRLMQRGILVLPTQRNTEAISLEWITRIRSGSDRMFVFTAGIDIVDGTVAAKLVEKNCTKPRYIVLPVHDVALSHFRLLMIDVSQPDVDISQSPVYYIEPLQWAAYSSLLQDACKQQWYQAYVKNLNDELMISQNCFTYIHLGQQPHENYCGDYVFSVLMLLANGDIQIDVPQSLIQLQGKYLTESDNQAIRMLALQEFGYAYLELQVNESSKKVNQRYCMDDSVETKMADLHVTAPKKDKTKPKIPSPLGLFVETAATLAEKNRNKTKEASSNNSSEPVNMGRS